MTWADLSGGLRERGLIKAGTGTDAETAAGFVTGVAFDSRTVEPGQVFVALKGVQADGAHDVGLARLRRVGGGGYDAVELAACLLDLAIIILALGVERGQQGAQARRVGRGRQRLYQRRLPLRHIGTPLLEHL